MSVSGPAGPQGFEVRFAFGPRPLVGPPKTAHESYFIKPPFVALFAKGRHLMRLDSVQDSTADLVLEPGVGEAHALFTNELDHKQLSVAFPRIDMPRSEWSLTGRLLSIEQLEGARAILYQPPYVIRGLRTGPAWNAMTLTLVEFTINGQVIQVDQKSLSRPSALTEPRTTPSYSQE